MSFIFGGRFPSDARKKPFDFVKKKMPRGKGGRGGQLKIWA